MNVPADNQVGSCRQQASRRHVRTPRNGSLARPPGRTGELPDDGGQRCEVRPVLRAAVALTTRSSWDIDGHRPELMAAMGRTELTPTALDVRRGMGPAPSSFPLLEFAPRMRTEPRRGRSTVNVVVAWTCTSNGLAPSSRRSCAAAARAEKVGAAAVSEVAARDHELRLKPLDERADRALDLRIVLCVPRADMDVRHVEDAGAHRRSRLQ